MTLCVKTNGHCLCQPDEGVFCPDYKPDAYVQCLMDTITELLAARPEEQAQLPGALWLAKWFHDTYEALAPEYGYETRPETRVFSSSSPNGKLMIAVCEKLRLAMNSERKE